MARFAGQGRYVPEKTLVSIIDQMTSKKSFEILSLPFDRFLNEAKKKPISGTELKAFFKEKQELYRIPEKKTVKYISLTVDQYKKKIVLDEDIIQRFYNRNKTSLYRIPPKVKVRAAVFKDEKAAKEFDKNSFGGDFTTISK